MSREIDLIFKGYKNYLVNGGNGIDMRSSKRAILSRLLERFPEKLKQKKGTYYMDGYNDCLEKVTNMLSEEFGESN